MPHVPAALARHSITPVCSAAAMSSVPFGGKKANRFFSRRLAELNEARTKSAFVKDLDPEIEATYGKEIAERHEVSENIKLHTKARCARPCAGRCSVACAHINMCCLAGAERGSGCRGPA